MGTRRVANKRLANNVIHGLEDIVALCKDLWGPLRAAQRRAAKQQDAIMLDHLSGMAEGLAKIERTARLARQGKYEE